MCLTLNAWGITESEIRQSVLDNFQLIEEARLKYEASKSEVTAAEGEFDHKLEFKSRNRIEDKYDNRYFETTIERNTGLKGLGLIVGHRQGLGTFPAYDGKYETSAAGEVFAGITLPLLRNFSTDVSRTNLVVAKIEENQAKEQLKLKQNIYVHKALSLFFKWQLELRNFHIRKRILKLAEERDDMLQRRYKSGDIEKVKLTDNQRSINKRRDEVQKSEIKLTQLETELSLYMPRYRLEDFAKDHEQSPALVTTLILPSISKEISSEKIPQLRILELEQEKFKKLEDLFSQSQLPGLAVDLLGAKELSPDQPYDRERLQVAVKFDFPFENRKAEGKTTAQAYKTMALEKQRDYVLSEISRTFSYSLKALELTMGRWETVSKETEATMIMASAEKSRWSQGSSDLFVVNLREEDVADVEVKKWTVLNDFQQLLIDAKLLNGTI